MKKYASVETAKSARILTSAFTWFFLRTVPSSRKAKPACIASTMIAPSSTNKTSLPDFRSSIPLLQFMNHNKRYEHARCVPQRQCIDPKPDEPEPKRQSLRGAQRRGNPDNFIKGLLNGWIAALRSQLDRKSTRPNSSHSQISYAVF